MFSTWSNEASLSLSLSLSLSRILSNSFSLSLSLSLLFHYSEENVNLIHSKKSELNCELVGSWTVEVGDLDQALHLWQYIGGYERVDHAQTVLSKDEVRILSVSVNKRERTRENAL